MNRYEVRYYLNNNTFYDVIEAPSIEAAKKLFAARYPGAHLQSIARI